MKCEMTTEQMHKLYGMGKSLREVGALVGLTGSAISYRFRKEGLLVRSWGGRRKEPNISVAEMHELYQDGKTLKEVGVLTGVNEGTVWARFKEAGLFIQSLSKSHRKQASLSICEMYRIYKTGKTINEVGVIAGINGGVVRNRFIEAGLSIRSASEAQMGHEVTPETRAKIGNANRGRKTTPETRMRMSVAQHKRYEDPAEREKISERNRKRYKDPAAREKMSQALSGENNPFYGRMHTLAAREKISKGNSGRSHTPETRAKMSKAGKGKKQSPKHVAKRVESRMGYETSPETRAKISETLHRPEVQKRIHEAIANNGNRSSGEWRLFGLLCSFGVPFIPDPQACLARKGGRHAFPDAYIPDIKLVIEYDGHSRHRAIGKDDDQKRDSELQELHGISTLRIANREIFTKHTVNRIAGAIREAAVKKVA